MTSASTSEARRAALPRRAKLSRAGLAAALLAMAACTSAPRAPYTPQTALVPFAAAGIEDRSAEYGELFCSALQCAGAEGGPWDECSHYIQTPGASVLDLPPLSNDYKILVISGLFAKCVSPRVQAYSDAFSHLRDRHGVVAEYFDVSGLGSCEYNAALIAGYLREKTAADSRKYIAVGYSKGATDLMVALATYPEVRQSVAALITVAAPVGGSRIPDLYPEWLVGLPGVDQIERCDKGDDGAVASLRGPARQAFLRAHPTPLVPTYSLIAISDEKTTSRALLPLWRKLSSLSIEQDSLIIAAEGVPPGAKFLGVVNGDHWAVALPFELAESSVFRRLVNHNHFPRTALLEAAVRLVVRDLQADDSAPKSPALNSLDEGQD